MRVLFFAFIAAVYLTINCFMWLHWIGWFRSLHRFLHRTWFTVFFTVIYIFLVVSPVSYILFHNETLSRAVKYISNIWIGIFIYAFIFLFLSMIATLLFRFAGKLKKDSPRWNQFVLVRGAVAAVFIISFSVYGMLHVGNVKTANYQVSIDKKGPEQGLKVVLIADTHMGYSIGEKQIKAIVDKINAQDPDLVCIAGDIFDNDYDALQNPDQLIELYRSIKSKYGVFACYGNHDVAENLIGGFSVPSKKAPSHESATDQFLKEAGIQLLKDQAQLVDDTFYIIGRRDRTKPGTSDGTRASIKILTSEADKSKPIFLIDHQPRGLQNDAEAGVDLVLSGHTHDGQIFPGNLIIGIFWENPCGYLKKDSMHSIVTSGAGVWGPVMRVGTDCEIVSIQVSFLQE